MGNIINDHIIDKGSDLLGLLFPYVGITKKAVDIYIENINKLDLPPDQKAFMVFNTKKTLKKIKESKRNCSNCYE